MNIFQSIDIFKDVGHTFLTVFLSLLPLIVLFIVFQIMFLKLPLKRLFTRFAGLLLAFVGIGLFLQGVHAGFFPAGTQIGEILGGLTNTWVAIPIGFLLGFLATFGEPAVRILSDQIEQTSVGSIKKSVVLYSISVGVAVFVALGMAKIVFGIPLTYIVIPGYILALGLLWFSDKTTVSIAFDAGGVATGPMAVTFLLAITIGMASYIQGRDPVEDGFGLIALIALAPILSLMIIGVIVRIKLRQGRKKEMKHSVLVVTIVRRGWGDRVLEASMNAGAEGGTIMYGRGTGIHEKQKILGIAIEPEKEILLSVTSEHQADAIMEAVSKAAEMDKPGTGLAFTIPIGKITGIVHDLSPADTDNG